MSVAHKISEFQSVLVGVEGTVKQPRVHASVGTAAAVHFALRWEINGAPGCEHALDVP